MVHPREDKNNAAMHRRGSDADARIATHGRVPQPNEVIGGRQEPPFEVVGLDAFSPLLMHVEFPASKDEIVAVLGQALIPVSSKRTMTVAEILDKVALQEFRGPSDVLSAIDQAWERITPHEGRGGRRG